MAADYDRLFQDPEDLEGPDDAATRPDYDVSSPPAQRAEQSPTPPPHLTPPMPPPHLVPAPIPGGAQPSNGNGQARRPMPVEWVDPAPVPPPPPPPPPPPIEPIEPSPPPPPSAPSEPAQEAPAPPPAPPPVAPQPPTQHGRHSRRAQREPIAAATSPASVPATPPPPHAAAPTPAAAQPLPPDPAPPPAAQPASFQPVPPAAPAQPGPPRPIPPEPQPSAAKPVPVRGWRRAVYAATRINPGLSPVERRELLQYNRIRRPVRGSYEIGVLGLKGGSGKTAVTAALGSVFAQVRGDRILAVDADQVSGNLADRVGRQSSATIEALLANDALAHYNDVRAHTSSNAVDLEVLAAAEYRPARHAITDDDWRRALTNIPRFYNLVLADCAADFFDPATRSVLSTASGLVIVCSVAVEGARQAEVAIEWLRQSRYRELLNHACLVLNHVVVGEPGVPVPELTRRFARYFDPGRIVALPWDRHVAAGTELRIDQLGAVFRRRIVELAAALSDDFDRSERR